MAEQNKKQITYEKQRYQRNDRRRHTKTKYACKRVRIFGTPTLSLEVGKIEEIQKQIEQMISI